MPTRLLLAPPPPDCLTFLRPWGSGLANFSYFFSTNFNLVAKKKSSFSDCRTNSLSDDYYFYIYCPRLLLFLFSSVLFLPFFLAAARWEKGPLMGLNPFWMRINSEVGCFSGILILIRKVEKCQRQSTPSPRVTRIRVTRFPLAC